MERPYGTERRSEELTASSEVLDWIPNKDSPGPYMAIPMIVKYGDNNELYVNPNSGLTGIMHYLLPHLEIAEIGSDDHIELCDENGNLINKNDFPTMMFMTNFIKPGVDEAIFVPAKVTRDPGNRKVSRAELLLKSVDQLMPETLAKLKKLYHLPSTDGKGKKKETPPSSAMDPSSTATSRESSISTVRSKKRQQVRTETKQSAVSTRVR